MNILLVTMSMQIGGAETHVLELAKGLKKKNYTVYVMSNGGDYVKELEENGIEHINAPMHNRNINNIVKSYKILKNTIQEKNIDIVHAHARIPAMISNFACKSTKTPMITTAHGVYKVNPILNMLTNWGCKTIAVSEDVKEYLIKEYDVDENDILITVNGIDMDKFSEKTDYSSLLGEFKIDKNKKHIVHVSRLDQDTSVIANMLIELSEKYDDAQFIIVGNGNAYENLKSKANDVNAKLGCEKVIMAGARTDINKFDALADIFVGVSRAALEAMSAKTPVILAGFQGYLGFFEESQLKTALDTNFCCRGMKLPTKEKIDADIAKLISVSPEKTAEIGDFNRKIVEKHYSLEKMVNDAIKMYEDV